MAGRMASRAANRNLMAGALRSGMDSDCLSLVESCGGPMLWVAEQDVRLTRGMLESRLYLLRRR